MKRVAEIDAQLAKIQKEGAIIKRHCTASPEEIRAEARRYAKQLDEIEALTLASKHLLSEAMAAIHKGKSLR